jgi:hypothetical protein
MISYNFQKKLENILQPKMDEYFNTNDAKKLLAGKESGHIMGTIVEEMCGDILSEEGLEITQELDNKGNPLPRAHSDFLIKSKDGAKNRTNVKFCSENPGQPNVCSINRMMDALRDGIIDGYYLLKVKYNRKEKNTKVYFVDVLDYIDCITYDGGTGQIMLKQNEFYKIYGPYGRENKLTLEDKSKKVYELYIKKMEEHIKRKQEQLEKRKKELISFL